MMKPFDLSSSVESLFERWPETVHLFIQNQMACPGCYLAGFESLEGALQTYQIKQEPFIDGLRQIITDSKHGESQADQGPPDTKGEPER